MSDEIESPAPPGELEPDRPLTGIEKARAARRRNQELRRQGLLPPLAREKVKPQPQPSGRPITQKIEPESLITPSGMAKPLETQSPLLSADQLATIRQKARERVDAELKQRQEGETADLMKKVLDAETLRLRREHGLANHLDDVVTVTINCPPYANCYLIDGTPYNHGYTYSVPRKLYDVLREQMARGWDAEERAGYPNKKFMHDPALRGPLYTQNPMGTLKFNPTDGSIVSRETQITGPSGAVVAGAPTNTAMSGGL